MTLRKKCWQIFHTIPLIEKKNQSFFFMNFSSRDNVIDSLSKDKISLFAMQNIHIEVLGTF